MSILFENNASGTVSVEVAGGTPGPADTTIVLQAGEGVLFPAVTTASGDFFYGTLEDILGNIEIVQCTNVSGDTLTVVRNVENTLPLTFPVGSKFEQRTTAGTFEEFIQRSGGVMTGMLDMAGNDIQDPVIVSTGSAELLGVPIRGSDGGTANELVVPSAGGAPTIGTSEIWHQGNDGPASGLDADTLDGVQGSGYIKPADATVAPSGTWNFTGPTTLDGDVTVAGFGTGGRVKDGGDVAQPVGYNVMPAVEQDTSATFNLGSNGGLIHKDTTAAADFTLPNDPDIPQGATWTVVCDAALGGNLFRIKGATGVTVKWFDQVSTSVIAVLGGNGFTLDDGAVCTVYKYNDTTYFLWGSSITESA